MPPQPAVAMAAEAEAEAQRLSPASLSAARQHVSTLNTTEREALLRALLEQYDRPEGTLAEGASMSQEMQPSSRPRHPASASSASAPSAPSAHPDTIFECPSLLEEEGEGQDDGLHHPTALAPAPNRPKRSASSSTSTSWPIRSMSASAVTAQHTPRQPQVRSHSISHSALRSSFSTKRQTADSVALFHYRSKSYAASPKPDEAKAKAEPELEPEPQPEREKEREKRREKQKQTAQVTANAIATTAPAEYRISTESTESAESTETTLHSGLNIITSANAYILQGPATVENSHREPRLLAYGCTSCGDQFSRRAAWAEHDATCRLIARHNGRRRHTRPQRAWACGFCAAFLGSVERYQDHVAGHFERGKTLSEWHYANVIYGLLHQPVVHKAWKRIWAARAAALPEGHRPKATWPSDCQFPTRRTDAYARSTPRTSFDTRDSSSTDDDGKNIVYLGLREALESFDPAVESASVMVLHAESLAIFISVPIKDGSRSRSDLDLDKDLDLEKDKNKDKDKQRSRAQPRDWGETGVQIATAAAMATATATIINSTPQREGPQSPKPDTFAMPAARATTAAAAAASPTTVVAPMTAPAPASAPPAPPTLGTSRRSKDDPLPALPVLATPAASSTNSTSSTNSINSSNKATKKDSKSRRASVRATALNPLSLFRSKDDSASKDKDKEKSKEKSKDKDKSKAKSKDKDKGTKSHKARLLPLGSTTAVTAETLSSTAPDRPPLWSDRPLPPLIMDGNPAASLAASSSSPPSPSSSPDTQARLVSADHYTLTSPASSSSLPPKADALDMDSMAAAYVDDFMTSINAKRVVHG